MMLKLPYLENRNFTLPEQLLVLYRGIGKLAAAVKGIELRTGDRAYKREFKRRFMHALYQRHTSELEINCAFCENLVRASCHRHCMKCGAGTYIHCSPLLPGMLNDYDVRTGNGSERTVPWYFKETCVNFKRLDERNYFRNFIIPLSSVTIDNFEVLEGLACGLSAGEKPCRVCASVDYGIYRSCSSHKDFDKSTPCDRITALMTSKYCS